MDLTRDRRCSSVAGLSGLSGARIEVLTSAFTSTTERTCLGRSRASRAAKYPLPEVPTTVMPFMRGSSSSARSSRSIWLSQGRAA